MQKESHFFCRTDTEKSRQTDLIQWLFWRTDKHCKVLMVCALSTDSIKSTQNDPANEIIVECREITSPTSCDLFWSQTGVVVNQGFKNSFDTV